MEIGRQKIITINCQLKRYRNPYYCSTYLIIIPNWWSLPNRNLWGMEQNINTLIKWNWIRLGDLGDVHDFMIFIEVWCIPYESHPKEREWCRNNCGWPVSPWNWMWSNIPCSKPARSQCVFSDCKLHIWITECQRLLLTEGYYIRLTRDWPGESVKNSPSCWMWCLSSASTWSSWARTSLSWMNDRSIS